MFAISWSPLNKNRTVHWLRFGDVRFWSVTELLARGEGSLHCAILTPLLFWCPKHACIVVLNRSFSCIILYYSITFCKHKLFALASKEKMLVLWCYFSYQLYEQLLGFSRPTEEEEEDYSTPELPPEFQPLLDRMEEQENRYECVLCTVKNSLGRCVRYWFILGQWDLRPRGILYNVLSGRLRFEVQPLTLLYSNYKEKVLLPCTLNLEKAPIWPPTYFHNWPVSWINCQKKEIFLSFSCSA